MLFNSVEFAIFFVAVLALTAPLPPSRRWWVLLPASYAFYMSWNVSYVFLILSSTLVAWGCALCIDAARSKGRKRAFLVASLLANLGLLFTFKYANFATRNLADLAAALGVPLELPVLDVLLPVGISFYTFQTLSYTIDVYRGLLGAERHLGIFALFVSFFPQLVAGPIERGESLLPQLRAPRPFDWTRSLEGLQLVLWGLVKKVVIADRCGLHVDRVYADPALHDGPALVVAVYLFAFQIYCDFSGYSDMAIGTARVFGVDLTLNFRQPFFSRTIPEFWQRWHITLLTWLRDYVYLPLAFRSRSTRWTYFSMMVLMTASGLWHGAAWTFVLWGMVHGAMLCLSRMTMPVRNRVYRRIGMPEPAVHFLRVLFTFHLFALSMVFFRASDLADVGYVLTHLHVGWESPAAIPWLALGVCAALFGIEWFQTQRPGVFDRLLQAPLPRWLLAYAGVMAVVLLGIDESVQFIYFQF